MAKKNRLAETPLYCLDAFGTHSKARAFYIETLREHLMQHPFVSVSHKHDFYLLLYITRGRGVHTIDFVDYPIAPGSFFMLTPGQVHSWRLENDTDGFIVFFEKDFFVFHNAGLTSLTLFQTRDLQPLLIPRQPQVVTFTLENLYREYTEAAPDAAMLARLLDLLLYTVAREQQLIKPGISRSDPAFKMRKLEQLIEENFIRVKQPARYAALMHISPSHLNALCRRTVGKTLSELINERVLLEAKRLLAYTDLSSKEVSVKLAFSGNSYFTRFFKKHTHQTPEQFKETLNRVM